MNRRFARSVGALTLLMPAALSSVMPAARAVEAHERTALVFLVNGASFEDLMRISQVRALAGLGGAGLMSSRTSLRQLLAGADLSGLPVRIADVGLTGGVRGEALAESLMSIGERIRRAVDEVTSGGEMVIVATPSPSAGMLRAKDELTGVVMASGPAGVIAAALGEPLPGSSTTLISDSTRRSGVVTSEDVLSTIDAYLGRPSADEPVIRLDPAPAPLELHARYLAERRMSVPVQTGAGIYVALMGLFGLTILVRRRPASRMVRRAAALGALSLFPLAATLLLVGHISSLTYASVVSVVVAGTVLATLAFDRVGTARGATSAAGIAGVAVLLAIGLEALLGWTAALTPLLGGSELDGGRFYGLPNVDIGLLVGAALLAAAWIGQPLPGAVLVASVGLFAGLPWTGSNLGGAVTLFAAAGLWYAIRRSGRFGLTAIGYGLVTTAAGTVATLAIHRYLSTFPTHVQRFLEHGSDGFVSEVFHRLGVGLDLIERNPFALVPVLGVPACLWLLLRPPPRLAAALTERPVWREAVLVILAASVVAYVANDSGAAALGLCFGSAVAALLYVSLAQPERTTEP